jgi:DNA-binding MarR family transcriptional regulator
MTRTAPRRPATAGTTRRDPALPEDVWRSLVDLVMDSRDDVRRAIRIATGLSPGRVRALRHLVDGPLTLRELAHAIDSDAPATTVTVNDLEQRGLVVRDPHPANRRAKLVSLTAAGRALALRARRIINRAPPVLATLPPADLAALARIVAAVADARATEAGARALDSVGSPP